MNKKLLIAAAAGFGFWFFFLRNRQGTLVSTPTAPVPIDSDPAYGGFNDGGLYSGAL